MIDALGSPSSLLLVGGTSDIAVATAHRYLAERPLRVVVAARDTPRRSAVATELTTAGAQVQDAPAEPPVTRVRAHRQTAGRLAIDNRADTDLGEVRTYVRIGNSRR